MYTIKTAAKAIIVNASGSCATRHFLMEMFCLSQTFSSCATPLTSFVLSWTFFLEQTVTNISLAIENSPYPIIAPIVLFMISSVSNTPRPVISCTTSINSVNPNPHKYIFHALLIFPKQIGSKNPNGTNIHILSIRFLHSRALKLYQASLYEESGLKLARYSNLSKPIPPLSNVT